MDVQYREARETDAPELLLHLKRVGGETDNLTFGAEGFNISAEREARFISRFQRNSDEIMLVATDGDTVVANAVIERERIPRLSHRSRLTLTVLRDYWGRGIMTEAVKGVVEFLFTEVGCNRIEIDHLIENPASGRVAQKCGFTKEGVRREYFNKNGVFHDDVMYALLRKDWSAEKG